MTLDQLIDSIKADATERFVDLAVGAIRGATAWFLTPWGAWILTWILAPIIRIGVKAIVHGADMGAYYLYKAQKNPRDAEAYQDSVRETKKANESGDKNAILKAREAQKKRFAVVASLSA